MYSELTDKYTQAWLGKSMGKGSSVLKVMRTMKQILAINRRIILTEVAPIFLEPASKHWVLMVRHITVVTAIKIPTSSILYLSVCEYTQTFICCMANKVRYAKTIIIVACHIGP